jgi:hypothetical protein
MSSGTPQEELEMSYINQTVNVQAFYFLNCLGNLRTFPKQIEYNNQNFTFSDGLQYLVKKGQQVIQIFEMTDGEKTYRLRREDNCWTLVGTK